MAKAAHPETEITLTPIRFFFQSIVFGAVSLMLVAMTAAVVVYAAPSTPAAWVPAALLAVASTLSGYLAIMPSMVSAPSAKIRR